MTINIENEKQQDAASEVESSRRNFIFGSVAAAGLTVAPGVMLYQTANARSLSEKASSKVRWGMLVDTTKQVDWNKCVDACNKEHGLNNETHSRDDQKTQYIRVVDVKNKGTGHSMSLPVMCQHCNHAPCETVCPVAATSHGLQGQNQMAYNRCVGTRYCANNCPYRVRRFNWFKYFDNNEFDFNMNNDLGRMVLNPDVVVRSRGVMEKCSMCIQMTQLTILNAKKEGRPVADGEFQTACSNACPTDAIVFGDVNDKISKVAQLEKDDRSFKLLDFVGTKPNVFYQLKVKNTKEA